MKNVAPVLVLTLLAAACTSATTDIGAGTSNGAGTGGAQGSENGSAQDGTENAGTNADGTPSAEATTYAKGVSITEVSVWQAVKVPVAAQGAPIAERNAPVVAGRPGIMRVAVEFAEGSETRELTALLTLKNGSSEPVVLKDTKTISAASSDDKIKSTFNFELTAEHLAVGTEYSVTLFEAAGTKGVGLKQAGDAVYPAGGALESLNVAASGRVHVVVVPLKYDADGTGRQPDVSAAQLERYRRTMMSRYPASEVEVTARAAVSWTSAIGANGTGFSNALNALVRLRQQDKVSDEVYYYGVFAPSASFGAFCKSGCVLGLSGVADDPEDSFLRASVGLGYTGDESASTMAHEIGHAHGREHAPCGGAQGVDRSFPYKGGGIGVWGYNIIDKTIISPSQGKDMMGYCQPEWVSDYTFSALHERIAYVNAASKVVQPSQSVTAGKSYQMISVDGAMNPTEATHIELKSGLHNANTDVELLGEGNAVIGSTKARFVRYDHVPGGFYVLPEHANPQAVRALRIPQLSRTLDLRALSHR